MILQLTEPNLYWYGVQDLPAQFCEQSRVHARLKLTEGKTVPTIHTVNLLAAKDWTKVSIKPIQIHTLVFFVRGSR